MFSSFTPVVEFLKLYYFPDCLAGDAHEMSRAIYLGEVRKLDRHFQEWLKESNQPPRPIRLGDLSDGTLKFAMAREVASPAEGGRGNTPGTANKLYRHIKPVWKLAFEFSQDGETMLVKRLCRTKPYREVKREPRAWFPEQIQAIMKAAGNMPGNVADVPRLDADAVAWTCHKPRPFGAVESCVFWPALMLTKLSIGVRINATMQIPTSNWDEQRAQLLVPGDRQKQRADQVFDLLESANDALKRLDPKGRGLPTLYADWPHDGGGRWNYLREHHERLLVRAGLFGTVEEITRSDHFHKYRKTVATEIAAKLGLEASRVYMGHSTSRMTELYVDKRRMIRTIIRNVIADPLAPVPALQLCLA